MLNNKSGYFAVLIMVAMASLACSTSLSVSAATATITQTAVATTATPTETPTPSLTPTMTPTNTPTSTSIPPRPPVVVPTIAPVVITAPASPIPGLTPSPTTVPGTLITYFTASPMELDPGGTFKLSWKVKSGTATLWPILESQTFGQWETVSLQGEKTITTSSDARNGVTYGLYAESGSVNEWAWVRVVLRCPDNWFFANPPNICPRTSAVVTQGAIQHFEHGLMIWVGALGYPIFALSEGDGYTSWIQLDDTWDSSQPESDPSIVPPPGYYQPVRGFGKVWRENPGQRDRLGWAIENEQPFTVSYQCDSTYKYVHCYVSAPEGVYHLHPWGSGWELWQGPGG